MQMPDWIEERAAKYREYFKLGQTAEIVPENAQEFEINPEVARGLNILISNGISFLLLTSSFDDEYLSRLYPTVKSFQNKHSEQKKAFTTS
jgi:hypothetical protein